MQDLQNQIFLNHIGGQWRASVSGETIVNGNPADQRDVVGRFQSSVKEDAEAAVQAAHAAFEGWKKTPVSRRAAILFAAADDLQARAEDIAIELTREEGKPLNLAKGEVLRSAETLRFYAVEAQTYTGETFPQDDPDMVVYTQREPLGVVTVISPWNFPISIPSRKIAPALMTGNTVVFKPSTDTPLSGYRLAEALINAGLPAGVLNFITGKASRIGDTLTQSPEVRAVTFTGSTAAGEAIHRSCCMTTRLQMELGGKNPLIVLADADLDQAVDLAVKGGLSLSGQACTGTSRILVESGVIEAFTSKLVARVKSLRIGSGLQTGCDLGPMATQSQLETVLKYVEIGKNEATLLTGGDRLTGDDFDQGLYVAPAVFTDVKQTMRIAREEIFGPVLCIIEVQDYDDAIAQANDSEYGLSAALATRSARYSHRFAQDIQSGTVKINRTTTGNLINAPFGGLKRSSTSTFRESGRVGLEFFTQIKTIYRAA
ncbi:aldehyde dehydrogenase family protein [Advenella mimigardefordensis]|uniref:Aldehyde dehydrogenase n=1 Tax=Advenella mimigardefordensis (strain DSM 17166 / LMG 22922 / DPN7) TaxID=1247726 RepID=W0PFD2_ADVMD|nr:aldehyde dehydrogenase family protein [Advenella mimigardefordensis]AHG65411.1 aldehyde dehydrogenase [Advenella mimigardefordensis DPN7]